MFQSCMNLFLLLNTKKNPIDFNSIFPYWSMGSLNCLVTDILQNIFLCVQPKKEMQV